MIIPEMIAQVEPPTADSYRIYDILAQFPSTQDMPSLHIVVDGVTLADSATVYGLWLRRAEWRYMQSKLQHYYDGTTQEEITGGYIFAEWADFITRNGQNLKRMIDALYSEYNPIENYNMREQGANGVKQDKHRTTPHGKIKIENTPYQTGINSTGDGAQTGKTVTETSYENADSETEYDNSMSIKNNDDLQETGYHRGEQHYLKRSGNIGVTTSAQMIEQELNLRTVDLIDDFVKRFFDKYCYYVG